MADETPEEPNAAQSPVLGSANGLGVLKEGWDEPMSDEDFGEFVRATHHGPHVPHSGPPAALPMRFFG